MDGRNEALLDLGRSVRGDNFPSPPLRVHPIVGQGQQDGLVLV